MPSVVPQGRAEGDFNNEREILYKVLFDMKNDLNDLKKLTLELLQHGNSPQVQEDNQSLIRRIYGDKGRGYAEEVTSYPVISLESKEEEPYAYEDATEEESLLLENQEKEVIAKALERHQNRRREAAQELGISERTLYRKLKQYDLDA